jgi:hypothetical protein
MRDVREGNRSQKQEARCWKSEQLTTKTQRHHEVSDARGRRVCVCPLTASVLASAACRTVHLSTGGCSVRSGDLRASAESPDARGPMPEECGRYFPTIINALSPRSHA